MKKFCHKCSAPYSVEDKDLHFYKKIDVPEPKLCPDCRQQRRFVFRNEWGLHKRKCDKCGINMVAMFPTGERLVYCDKCWWSDEFDPRNYGREFDFNRSFFKQMDDLLRTIPLPRLVIGDCENSEYTNYAWKLKN
jgi:Zn ribbon nucleic-acid-binding protein